MAQRSGQLRWYVPLYDLGTDSDRRNRQLTHRLAHFLLCLEVGGDIHFTEDDVALLQIGAHQLVGKSGHRQQHQCPRETNKQMSPRPLPDSARQAGVTQQRINLRCAATKPDEQLDWLIYAALLEDAVQEGIAGLAVENPVFLELAESIG